MGQLEEGNAGLLAAEVLQEDGRHEKKDDFSSLFYVSEV